MRDVREQFEIMRPTPNGLACGAKFEVSLPWTATKSVCEITIPSYQTTLGEFAPRPTRKGVNARPSASPL